MKWLTRCVVYFIIATPVVIIMMPFYLLKVLCDFMMFIDDKYFDWLDSIIQDQIKNEPKSEYDKRRRNRRNMEGDTDVIDNIGLLIVYTKNKKVLKKHRIG